MYHVSLMYIVHVFKRGGKGLVQTQFFNCLLAIFVQMLLSIFITFIIVFTSSLTFCLLALTKCSFTSMFKFFVYTWFNSGFWAKNLCQYTLGWTEFSQKCSQTLLGRSFLLNVAVPGFWSVRNFDKEMVDKMLHPLISTSIMILVDIFTGSNRLTIVFQQNSTGFKHSMDTTRIFMLWIF